MKPPGWRVHSVGIRVEIGSVFLFTRDRIEASACRAGRVPRFLSWAVCIQIDGVDQQLMHIIEINWMAASWLETE
jgi:hypothetical protein